VSEPRELPEGWAWATLGELAGSTGLFCDGDWVESKDQDPTGEVRLLQLADVGDGEFLDRSSRHLTKQRAIELRCTFLAPGDLMISRMADPIGRTCIYPGLTTPAVTVVDVAILRPHDGIDPAWLMRAINSPVFRALAVAAASGTTRSRISRTNLGEMAIPVPPLAEQRRIVAKLDELLARSRRAREALAEVPALVARYRESVLAAAFRGDLTADWREANPAAARGDWARVELDALCEAGRPITYGVVKLGEEVPDGVPCLRTSNVRWLRLECDGMKRIAPDLSAQYGRTVLRGGEVLVNVRGTLGGVAVVEPSMAGWNISREVAVVPSDASRIEPRFLAFTIGAAHSQSVLRGMEKGNAYTGINIEDLRKLPIELPPLAEQREIVRRVEAAFARVDAVEAAVAEQRARLDAYDRSLLARAFAGELVPQDPADEPAAALLARLRAERGEAAPARGRRRRG